MKFNIILFSTLITDAVSKTAPYNTGILSPSFSRKLVTQECLDGELLMLEDEKLDNLTGALYAACPEANQITVGGDGSMSRISDMTDCDTTSITEYCDANVNYKSATLRPNIEIACTNISITNSTSGEVMNLPGVTQQFINNVGCFAQSCPDDVDWTEEDIAQNAEAQVPPGASCTVLFLEEKSEEGAAASANAESAESNSSTTASTAVAFLSSSLFVIFAFQLIQ